jgi:NADH dehydrogenase/NADH:ubiquinone oxidoreductase subunit G
MEDSMSTQARLWLLSVALLAVGAGFYLAERGRAGEDKAITDGVNKIADALEKGDKATAEKMAQGLAKKLEDVEALMSLFKPRTKKGLGVGPKAGAITPDGIEIKLLAIGRDAPTQATLNKEADALVRMAYITAAIGEVAVRKPPDRDMGKKTKKAWVTYSKEMVEAVPQFAAAAKSKSPNEVKTAASKLAGSCNRCHEIFK